MAFFPNNPNGRAASAASAPVVVASQDNTTAGMGSVGSSIIDSVFTTPITGTGVTFSQAGGALSIVAGTSTNAEFFTRSVVPYSGALRVRAGFLSSQRIANNNVWFGLADLVGEGLAYSIISSTQVNITITNHGFTTQNVGQFCNIAGITGAAGVPGRYAIASIIDANTVQFTVAGWPASGSGTCVVFGRNHIRVTVNGTVSTTNLYNTQRNGWAAADISLSSNSTLSPGTIFMMQTDTAQTYVADALRASTTVPVFVTRGNTFENVPEGTVPLYMFIWSFNGTSAPASSTTFSFGHMGVESMPNQGVYIEGFRGSTNQRPLPVAISTGTVTTVTLANLGLPSAVADVTSAALTTTTTTAALTPTFGTTYVVNIPVTSVSGTSPTLDVGVEESDDTGTNWYRVYDFPRITATGIYRSPPLTLRGNRVRYVQTVGGTTPSFTRAINRLQRSDDAPLRVQFIDRTIAPNTLNSVTPSYYVEGCADFNFMVRCTAQTTAATITVQFSHDGTNWLTTTNTITTAVGIVQVKVQNEQWKFARLNVTAAGSGITLGEAMIVGRA